MFKYFLAFVFLIHGLIHLMGTAKAYGCNVQQLTKEIIKPVGIAWLITALLFITAALLLLLKKDAWYIVSIPAITLSQVLIILVWKDAKWGTVANAIILVAIIRELSGHATIEQ